MSHRLRLPMITAVAALGLASPLLAQGRSAVSTAELDAAVVGRPAGSRDAVRAFLMTDQVRKVAGRIGVSTSELSARAAALDQASLDQIAARTSVGDRALAGGADKIVISTTVIIIALLIIILLVK